MMIDEDALGALQVLHNKGFSAEQVECAYIALLRENRKGEKEKNTILDEINKKIEMTTRGILECKKHFLELHERYRLSVVDANMGVVTNVTIHNTLGTRINLGWTYKDYSRSYSINVEYQQNNKSIKYESIYFDEHAKGSAGRRKFDDVSDFFELLVKDFGADEAKDFKGKIDMDGNMFCATRHDFENLQESHAGFGETPELAIKDLEERENG